MSVYSEVSPGSSASNVVPGTGRFPGCALVGAVQPPLQPAGLEGMSSSLCAEVLKKYYEAYGSYCAVLASSTSSSVQGFGSAVGGSEVRSCAESSAGGVASVLERRRERGAGGRLVGDRDDTGYCYLAAVKPEHAERVSARLGPGATFGDMLQLACDGCLLDDNKLRAVHVEKHRGGGYHVTSNKKMPSLYQTLAALCYQNPADARVKLLDRRFSGSVAAVIGHVPRIDSVLAGDLDPGPLKLCRHWLHSGECEFTAVGCKFGHSMPTSATVLKQYGLLDYPRWWRESQAGGWRRSSSVASSSRASLARSSVSSVVGDAAVVSRLEVVETALAALTVKCDSLVSAVADVVKVLPKVQVDEGLTPVASSFSREWSDVVVHSRPGYCYLMVVRPGERSTVARVLGPNPVLLTLAGLAAEVLQPLAVLEGLKVYSTGEGHAHVGDRDLEGAVGLLSLFSTFFFATNYGLATLAGVASAHAVPVRVGALKATDKLGQASAMAVWLARVYNKSEAEFPEEFCRLLSKTAAMHSADDKRRLKMLEALGDSALTTSVAVKCSNENRTAQEYQEARSAVTSNPSLSRIFVAAVPEGLVSYPSGVVPGRGNVGAYVIEAVLGLGYQLFGSEAVYRACIYLGVFDAYAW